MRILICSNDLPDLIGFRGDFIQHLRDKSYDVTIVLPNTEKDRATGYKIPDGCKIKFIHMIPSSINPAHDLVTFFCYVKILLLWRPDIVFNYTIKPNIYCGIAAALCRVKTVSMLAGLGYMFQGNGFVNKVGKALYRFALNKTNRIIVLNKFNHNLLIENKFIKESKTTLFTEGEGVNLSTYDYVPKTYTEPSTFIMVARVLKDKGYYEYVEAAKIVKQKYPNVVFELLGKTAYNSPMGIKRRVLERDVAAGHINYIGFTKDVPSFLRRSVVMVLPSYHEGLNRSLMEACAMGCPIITSNIPGCQEMVDEGRNGYTAELKNAADLADRIIKFIELSDEQKNAMSAHSREWAETHFNVNNVIKRYDDIIAELVNA